MHEYLQFEMFFEISDELKKEIKNKNKNISCEAFKEKSSW